MPYHEQCDKTQVSRCSDQAESFHKTCSACLHDQDCRSGRQHAQPIMHLLPGDVTMASTPGCCCSACSFLQTPCLAEAALRKLQQPPAVPLHLQHAPLTAVQRTKGKRPCHELLSREQRQRLHLPLSTLPTQHEQRRQRCGKRWHVARCRSSRPRHRGCSQLPGSCARPKQPKQPAHMRVYRDDCRCFVTADAQADEAPDVPEMTSGEAKQVYLGRVPWILGQQAACLPTWLQRWCQRRRQLEPTSWRLPQG